MIHIEGLNKQFGTLQALKSIDLELEPGKITAVLGPNGAGKTTLIKCILGLVKSDTGVIIVDGTTVNGSSDYRRKIGYMPQLARYPENLTVTEIIAMIQDIRGYPVVTPDSGGQSRSGSGTVAAVSKGSTAPGAGDDQSAGLDFELWHRFGLDSEKDKPFRTLSGGNRQKVSAVLAFMFRPSVLFLDEPSAGLDPVSSSILKDKIMTERDRGATVILTSHIMSEVQELAGQVVYLLEGELYFEMGMQELLSDTGESTLERAIASKLNGRYSKQHQKEAAS